MKIFCCACLISHIQAAIIVHKQQKQYSLPAKTQQNTTHNGNFILKSPFKLTSYKFSFQQESINNFMLFSVFPDLDKYSYFAYKTSANHTFLICSYPE